MSVLPEIDLEFTERAMGCGQKVKNRSLLRNCGVKLVVEYSTTQNAHPVGVRRAVLKTHPNERYGAHPRIYSNHLTG